MANVVDIYTIVNEAAAQSMGTKGIAVIDLQTFLTLGNDVLSSQTDTDNFYGALVQRISKTIFSNRPYTSNFSGVIRRDQTTWGQAVQKISVDIDQAQTDGSLVLTEGQSVDMYKVHKAKVKQKIFKKSSAYEIQMTYQRQWLKQAFTSPDAMGSFISSIAQRVSDTQTLAEENLTQLAVVNLCAELDGNATRQVNLLTDFNAAFSQKLTADSALYNGDFLKYVSAQIDLYSRRMRRMAKLYNDGSVARHTPKEYQLLFIASELDTNLRVFGYSSTYNADYMKLPNYTVMPYWQDPKSPNAINVERASTGAATSITNQLCLLADYEALGTYRHDLRSYTTPFNSKGEYYNQFIKAEDMFFNDLSENAISFVLE